VDAAAWGVGLNLAAVVRWDFHFGSIYWPGLVLVAFLAAVTQLAAGYASGLYTGRSRFGSFDEVAGVVRATALTTAFIFILNRVLSTDRHLVPVSVPLAGGVAALVIMAGTRYLWRLQIERRIRPQEGNGCQRLLVFGAGEGAAQIISAMLRDPASHYLPVAMLDDCPSKRNLRIMGVRVAGGRSCLARVAAEFKAETLLIAIPSADAGLVTELCGLAAAAGLATKLLPPVKKLLDGHVDVSDIHDVTPADLLGRHEIKTDIVSIAGYLTGKRVLVTGAGGSIGSELCRQLFRLAPAELIMVDRDESALHAVQLSIEGRALLDSPNLVLVDIRDRPAVDQLFADRRPQVVFHAAALKHLSLLERYPAEAVKTNVWASLYLLNAALASGVERFVNISTDKAADPSCVLGYTKRIVERLVAYASGQADTTCLSVRFGNVLGSRGSVLSTFHAQIERGGPITVTDPDVTRYFMTVEEAVQLVIQAGAIGRNGEALVLDMGEPVRIAEVARLLAAKAERPVGIQFTGLRPGEKLHEIRLGAGENDHRPVHPLISHVAVTPLHPEAVAEIATGADRHKLVRQLAQVCGQPTAVGVHTAD